MHFRVTPKAYVLHKGHNLYGLPLTQPSSSLKSLQSFMWLHCRLPWMQDPSPHWNSSGRHVGKAVHMEKVKYFMSLEEHFIKGLVSISYV